MGQMLERLSRLTSRNLPTSPEKAAQYLNVQRRIRSLGAVSLTALALYSTDVGIGKTIESQAEIKVNIIDNTPLDESNSDQAIIAINGYHTIDADDVAMNLGPIIQDKYFDGEIWSIDTGNAPLIEEHVADAIEEKADERGINKFTFIGYSAGGITACDTINHIMSDSGIPTELNVQVSTPSNEDVLRGPNQVGLEAVKLVKDWPGVEYSNVIRFSSEMFAQKARFKDVGAFGKIALDTIHRMQNNSLPGMWLQFDQALSIASADFDKCYEKMSTFSPEIQMPVTVNFGTAPPGWDYMLDDDQSQDDISLDATRNGRQFIGGQVPGMVHTRPDINTEEFAIEAARIKATVAEAVELEQSRNFGFNDSYVQRFMKY